MAESVGAVILQITAKRSTEIPGEPCISMEYLPQRIVPGSVLGLPNERTNER